MAVRLLVHLPGEESLLADADALPNPTDQFVHLRNVRRKDGKPVSYLVDNVQSVLFSWSRISLIEVLDEVKPAAATAKASSRLESGTTVLGFFREESA